MMNRALAWLQRLESALLALLLFAMIALAAYQVFARNLFDTGFTWGDGFVRVAVLWVTVIGAMVASRSDDHIRMDVLARYFSTGTLVLVRRATALFTALVSFGVAWSSIGFVQFEREDGTLAFGAVPAWWCEVILPVGFAVIGLRYLLRAFVLSAEQVLDDEGDQGGSYSDLDGDGVDADGDRAP
ncbi:MAG: TRAP transporter small permease [Pseudomonadota bacterium]